MQKAAIAEAKLANIAKTLGISPSGLFWMDHALDPFKDLVKPHTGYPDKNMDPSIVEVVKQTAVVTAPGGVNWDASIFLDQVLNDCPLRTTTRTQGNQLWQHAAQGVTDYDRGGLVIRTNTAGTPLDMTSTRSNLTVDNALYTSESCRIVAMGFEIHDTTAELDKQGSIVVWRLDQPTEKDYIATVIEDAGITACIPSCIKLQQLAQPPVTGSEALDLLGSQQWEAKEGCYVVPVQIDDSNPALPLHSYAPYCIDAANQAYFPVIASTGASKLISTNPQCVPSPYSMCGAFILGLKPTASLTINFNYMIERFPNKNSTIKRLCYPSPPYDNRALTLYSDIARNLPVGVPVAENGAGDWIKGIANLAGNVAKMIPHPYAQIFGKGAEAVEQTIQLFEKIPKKQPLAITNSTNSTTTKRTPDGKIITTHTVSKSSPTSVLSGSGNYRSNKQPLKRPNRTRSAIQKSGVIVSDNPWPKGKKK